MGPTGTESLVITAGIPEPPRVEPTFPITVRQANALLEELNTSWIKDKEIVGAFLEDLRHWVDTLSSGRS